MSNYIVIDGGTTNTRIGLLAGDTVVEVVRLGIGTRVCMDNRQRYFSEIEAGIRQLMAAHPEYEIEQVLAAGMVTSEFGLCEVPHRPLPAGIADLHDHLHRTELFGLPFAFVPGVKNAADNYRDTDIMRGEEAELFGLMAQLPGDLFHNSVVVLPGSHSKFIYTDEAKRITSLTSLLTGEMIAALSQYTLLKDAVHLQGDGYSSEYLMEGYTYCTQAGINAALMKARVLKNLFAANEMETYSFFLGVVLQAEIAQLLQSPAEKIVIAGRKQIKEPMVELLRRFSEKPVVAVEDAAVQQSTFRGMKAIYEYRI